MVNQSALAQEIDGIIEMVPAFSPEFHALIELRGKIAPQPRPPMVRARAGCDGDSVSISTGGDVEDGQGPWMFWGHQF